MGGPTNGVDAQMGLTHNWRGRGKGVTDTQMKNVTDTQSKNVTDTYKNVTVTDTLTDKQLYRNRLRLPLFLDVFFITKPL